MALFTSTDTVNVQESPELRMQVARLLHSRADAVVTDSAAGYPFAGLDHIDADDRRRLGELAFQLLVTAVRNGGLDGDYPGAAAIGRFSDEHGISLRLLLDVFYLMERSALDELAQDESFGIESEPWPSLSQMMHRASLDVCAAASEHVGGRRETITDPLTTLHTKALFVVALEKEIQRAERFGHPFALIVLDVDSLADINERHGRGAGDRVIERVGIVVRHYFRETDWVGRLGGDMFGVLMPEIQGFNAERLAEHVRAAVQERLRLHDHRSDEAYSVTVSVGVLVVPSAERTMGAEALLEQAVAALRRARDAGGNTVVVTQCVVAS